MDRKWKNPNFLSALKHSFDGVKYVLKNERNLKIQLVFAIFVIILGKLLNLNEIEYMVLFLTIGLVVCTEIINTVIEVCLDIYSEEYNEKIKLAKDIASRSSFNSIDNISCKWNNFIFTKNIIK